MSRLSIGSRAHRRAMAKQQRRLRKVAGKAARVGATTAVVASTVGLLNIPSAHAVPMTFTVTSLADDGGGADLTLREALSMATANPGHDTIEFDSDLFTGGPGTITLMSTLFVGRNTTIAGPGQSVLTIDADGAANAFVLRSDEYSGQTISVTISGLSVTGAGDFAIRATRQNEAAPAGPGNMGPNVTINGARVHGNGGGLFIQSGVAEITNATIDGNHREFTLTTAIGAPWVVWEDARQQPGGGVSAEGSDVTITGSIINDNSISIEACSTDPFYYTCWTDAYGDGGGVGVIDSTLTISDTDFNRNSAVQEGGAISARRSTVSITTGSVINDNDAFDGSGGGLFVDDPTGDITITDSEFTENYADSEGGGLWVGSWDNEEIDFTITGNTISGNDAYGDGAGAWVVLYNGANANVGNNTFTGNRAYGHGGGLYLYVGGSDVTGTAEFEGNTFIANYAGSSGGGARVEFGYRSAVTVAGNVFTSDEEGLGNEAGGDGGGLSLEIWDSGTITIRDNTFENGFTEESGGGAQIDISGSGAVSITGNTFTGNVAEDDGGGLYLQVDESGAVTIDHNTFTGNESLYYDGEDPDGGGAGGGAYIDIADVSAVTVTNNTFTDNVSYYSGGGLYLGVNNGGDVVFSHNSFTNNESLDASGGGAKVGIDFSDDFTAEHNTFTGNDADYSAGALYLSVYGGNDIAIAHNVFEGNSSVDYVGGLYADFNNVGNVTIAHNRFEGNSSEGTGGLYATFQGAGAVVIDANTFTGNSAMWQGGAFVGASNLESLTISNNTFDGNEATTYDAGGLSLYNRSEVVATLVNNTISNNSAGGKGGGLLIDGDAAISHSTIAGNSAGGEGDSLFVQSGSVTVSHSILSGDAESDADDIGANAAPVFDVLAPISLETAEVTVSWSIVSDPGELDLSAGNNLVGVDPMLGTLSNNGGSTKTQLPQEGSPAIGAGDPAIEGAPALDQRGLARVLDGRIDIGAVEVEPVVVVDDESPSDFTPIRAGDTRAIGGPIGANSSRRIQIAGVGDVPATGVRAVLVNVTATRSTQRGYVTVWPAGAPMPQVSTLNTEPGQDVANMAIIELGEDGAIEVFNSDGTTDVAVDVLGFFGFDSNYMALPAARITDTRVGNTPMTAGSTLTVHTGQPGGTSVVVNITATQSVGQSFLTAWAGGDMPHVSSMQTDPTADTALLTVVKTDSNGDFKLFNQSGSTHVIVDLVGRFNDAPRLEDTAHGIYTGVAPIRSLDTRNNIGFSGPAVGGTNYRFKVTGGSVPDGVKSVVLNLTATQSSAPAWVTLWGGGVRPLFSNLNTEVGNNTANMVVAEVDAEGYVSVYTNTGATHLIADITGYFV